MICAIVVEEDHLNTKISSSKVIVASHAGSGELKSSNIGSAFNRLRQILIDILEEEINAFCLVVDKKRILKDSGLRFKPSFYKFLHRMFYNRLKSSSLEISVYADEYGRSKYAESFE